MQRSQNWTTFTSASTIGMYIYDLLIADLPLSSEEIDGSGVCAGRRHQGRLTKTERSEIIAPVSQPAPWKLVGEK